LLVAIIMFGCSFAGSFVGSFALVRHHAERDAAIAQARRVTAKARAEAEAARREVERLRVQLELLDRRVDDALRQVQEAQTAADRAAAMQRLDELRRRGELVRHEHWRPRQWPSLDERQLQALHRCSDGVRPGCT
jgi:uncharacterized protein YlxW (UPF0749 family)